MASIREPKRRSYSAMTCSSRRPILSCLACSGADADQAASSRARPAAGAGSPRSQRASNSVVVGTRTALFRFDEGRLRRLAHGIVALPALVLELDRLDR